MDSSSPKDPLEGQAEFAWFLGGRQSASPAVRGELLATIHESIPVATLAACLTSGVALIALINEQQPWALLWLLAEALILAIRLPLLHQQRSRGGDVNHLSFVWLNRITSVWFMVLGLGALGCLLSNKLLLIVLAANLLFGLIGALASRLAAAPRYAMLLKALLLAPSFAALWLAPSSWLYALVLSAVLYSVLMQQLTRQNHRLLHDKITAEQKNLKLLTRDPLTGLSNRRELRSTLQMLGSSPTQPKLCVLYLDLDGFKAVNDNYGHPAGDQLLVEVGQRLKRLVRDDDLVCRLGGDEFIVLLMGTSGRQAECKAEQIIKELSKPILINHGKSARIGVSIGIAIAPDHSKNPETLVGLADQALYQAKAGGKGIYRTWLA